MTYLRLISYTQFHNSRCWHFVFLPTVLQVQLLNTDGKAELLLSYLISFSSQNIRYRFFEKFHFDISICAISLLLIWKVSFESAAIRWFYILNRVVMMLVIGIRSKYIILYYHQHWEVLYLHFSIAWNFNCS